nr:MAG TPA: hypothetical protein [Caudoviricetes sp.]
MVGGISIQLSNIFCFAPTNPVIIAGLFIGFS